MHVDPGSVADGQRQPDGRTDSDPHVHDPRSHQRAGHPDQRAGRPGVLRPGGGLRDLRAVRD
ncbi:hypothetical protein GCM10017602_12640 [Herbiconiux flava]|nr:hypothetical protein GCM10017602_12640 [Herbiconiux flava]